MNNIKTKDILKFGIKEEEENSKTYSQLSGKIYRKISIYPTKVALKLKLSPDLLSILFLFSIIGASILFFNKTYTATIWGAIILFIGRTSLDYIDGNVAKYLHYFKNRKYTLHGKYLDYITHYIAEPLIFISILQNFIIGLITAICYILTHVMRLQYEKMSKENKTEQKQQSKQNKLSIFIQPLETYEQFILIGAIFNILNPIAMILAILIIIRMPISTIIFYKKLLKIDKSN